MATLEEITGNLKAKMQWVLYFRNVVTQYHVVIEGWPENIPFINLSSASSALLQLEQLLHKWELDTMFWKHITDVEFTTMETNRNA